MLLTLRLCSSPVFPGYILILGFVDFVYEQTGRIAKSEHVLLIKALFRLIGILLILTCFWVISLRVLPTALIWRHFYHVLTARKRDILKMACVWTAEIFMRFFSCLSLGRLFNHSPACAGVGEWVVLNRIFTGHGYSFLLSRQRPYGKERGDQWIQIVLQITCEFPFSMTFFIHGPSLKSSFCHLIEFYVCILAVDFLQWGCPGLGQNLNRLSKASISFFLPPPNKIKWFCVYVFFQL